jgi:Membrane-bound lysozyme-inhibitor of c-type lysozyme
MKSVHVGALVISVIAAIAAPFAIAPATAQEKIVRYQCEEGPSFQVTFHQNKNNSIRDYARVKLPNQAEPLKLRPLDSRDGIKYGSNLSLLKILDNQASLEMNWQVVSDRCVAVK